MLLHFMIRIDVIVSKIWLQSNKYGNRDDENIYFTSIEINLKSQKFLDHFGLPFQGGKA